ncbi:MAG: Uma2 family endonuclease [Anaerolineae bacterium]|nr:Uma2 family endonuclease [Anaerolineae bacterium]
MTTVATAPATLPPKQGAWTYQDYLHFVPDDTPFRYEVIDGNIYMHAAPLPIHQKVLFNLAKSLGTLQDAGQIQGAIYFAPIDVVMGDQASPVQPDLIFIRQDNLNIVGETHINGVPDLIVEVLSSNWQHDRHIKFDAYRRAGVPEYWIIDPQEKAVDVFVLRGSAYVQLGRFTGDMTIRSERLPTFSAQAAALFL